MNILLFLCVCVSALYRDTSYLSLLIHVHIHHICLDYGMWFPLIILSRRRSIKNIETCPRPYFRGPVALCNLLCHIKRELEQGGTKMVVVSNTNSFAKEMNIRRRISSIYNKREDDFSSLKEFNDYLEEVEDMICNLVDGINVPEIEARIAAYEKENAEQIINSRARKAEEVAAALAAVSVKAHAAQSDDNGVVFNQSSQLGPTSTGQGQYAPAIAGTAFGQPRPTGMAPQPLPFGGSQDIDEEEMVRLRAERGGLAGGWTPDMSRKRALEEAFGSLWI